MFRTDENGEVTRPGGAIVVGVLDTPDGRDLVRRAAVHAAHEGAVLHLVAVYDLNDSVDHRRDRTVGPRDVAHLMSPKADAELVARRAVERVESLRVPTTTHVHRGAMGPALRKVARQAGAQAIVADGWLARGLRMFGPCAVTDATHVDRVFAAPATPRPRARAVRSAAARSASVAGAGDEPGPPWNVTAQMAELDALAARYEVVVHGHTVSYRVAGGGPVLVLLHGLFDSALTWRRVVEPLSEHFTVIAPDLLGHGLSERPRGIDYTLGAHSDLLRRFLRELGHERVTLVGHSMGGGLAMLFAAQHPECVERLALLATGGLGREVHRAVRWATMPGAGAAVAVLSSRPGCGAIRVAAACAGGADRPTGRALREGAMTLERLRGRAARRAALATLRAVVEPGGQRLSALERIDELAGIPLLLVWGSKDPLIPVQHGIAGHEAHPESRMVVLDGVGHHPHVARPGIVAETIASFAATAVTAPRPSGVRFARQADVPA